MRRTFFGLCGFLSLLAAERAQYMDKVVVFLALAFFCVMVWGVLELAAAIKEAK